MEKYTTQQFIINAYDTRFYCKIIFFKNEKSIISANMYFGKKNEFYISFILDNILEKKGRIINIKYYKQLLNNNEEYSEEMYQFIQTAIHTFNIQFPNIEHLIFTDNSYIHFTKDVENIEKIEDIDMCQIKLAYDCIIKYNTTYYEKYFEAFLEDEEYKKYRNSLNILDLPINYPFEVITDFIDGMNKYEEIYNSSLTHRGFIKSLVNTYKKEYYFEVSEWFDKYFRILNLSLPSCEWYITPNNIKCPYNYNIISTNIYDTIYNFDDIIEKRQHNFYINSSSGTYVSILGYYKDFIEK